MAHSRENRPLTVVDNYADILVNAFAAVAAALFTLAFLEVPVIPKVTSQYWFLATVFVFFMFMSFLYQTADLYGENAYIRMSVAVIGYLKINGIVCGTLSLLSLFATRETRGFWLSLVTVFFLFSSALLIVKREIVFSVIHYVRVHRYKLRKLIIIGDNTETAKQYIRQLNLHPEYGYMVQGYVGDCIRAEVGCDKLGSFENLEEILDKYRPDEAVFAIDSYNKKRLMRLVNLCDDRCIKVYFLPVLFGYFKSSKQIDYVGNIPLINIHQTPLDNRSATQIKRAVDIIGSLLLILLASPIMLVTAIVIHFSSPGPVIFKQNRVGRLGKTFTMYKFRSMRQSGTEKTGWSHGGDSRRTKFGAFIRATAIDELPQLFNVLKGDMSLVGPRPEIPHFVDAFRTQIPMYMLKHYCKPGMTGLSQIKGLRGDTSMTARIQTDIYYIEHWSFWMDLWILIATPFRAFNRSEIAEPVLWEEEDARAVPAILEDGEEEPTPNETKNEENENAPDGEK